MFRKKNTLLAGISSCLLIISAGITNASSDIQMLTNQEAVNMVGNAIQLPLVSDTIEIFNTGVEDSDKNTFLDPGYIFEASEKLVKVQNLEEHINYQLAGATQQISGQDLLPRESGSISIWYKAPEKGFESSQTHLTLINDWQYSNNPHHDVDVPLLHAVTLEMVDNYSARIRFIENTGTVNVLSSDVLSWIASGWHHIVVSWGMTGRQIYQNGVLVASTSDYGILRGQGHGLAVANSQCKSDTCPPVPKYQIWDDELGEIQVLEQYISQTPAEAYRFKHDGVMLALGETVAKNLMTPITTYPALMSFQDINDTEPGDTSTQEKDNNQEESTAQDDASDDDETFGGEPPPILPEPVPNIPYKVILLIMGDEYNYRHLVHDTNADKLRVIYSPKKNAAEIEANFAYTYQKRADFGINSVYVESVDKLITKYQEPEFEKAYWQLVTLRATSVKDIDKTLELLAKKSPAQIVVQYVGHGISRYFEDLDYSTGDDPALSLSGTTRIYKNGAPVRIPFFPKLSGAHSDAAFEAEIRAKQSLTEYKTEDLVNKIHRLFPTKNGLRPILIVDGCETARTLTFSKNVDIVVGVDTLYASVAQGLFSAVFARHINPEAFDLFNEKIPQVISNVNASLTTDFFWFRDNKEMKHDPIRIEVRQRAMSSSSLVRSIPYNPVTTNPLVFIDRD